MSFLAYQHSELENFFFRKIIVALTSSNDDLSNKKIKGKIHTSPYIN